MSFFLAGIERTSRQGVRLRSILAYQARKPPRQNVETALFDGAGRDYFTIRWLIGLYGFQRNICPFLNHPADYPGVAFPRSTRAIKCGGDIITNLKGDIAVRVLFIPT